MKLSKMHVPTLRQVGIETEYESFKLMIRAGLLRKVEHGLYAYLPLGISLKNRMKTNIESYFYEESVNKFELPTIITNKCISKERFNSVQNRNYELNTEYGYMIGCWREENFLASIKSDIKSYKKLPFSAYVNEKYPSCNDKVRENLFECAENEHLTYYYLENAEEDLESKQIEIKQQMEEVLKSFGIQGIWIKTDVEGYDEIGSEALMVKLDNIGEVVFNCEEGHFIGDKENTPIYIEKNSNMELLEKEEIYTPAARTIEELEAFLKISGNNFVKSLIYKIEDEFIMVEVPGDRDVDEYKLARYLKVMKEKICLAEPSDVIRITGAEVGFAGPIDLKEKIRKIADISVSKMTNVVVGGNKTEYHIKNVNYGRDFDCELADDLLLMKESDVCPICNKEYEKLSGVRVASLNNYSKKYLESNQLEYLDENGKNQTMQLLRLDINLDAIIGATLEINRDEKGFILNNSMAPYDIEVIVVNIKDELQMEKGLEIYKKLVNRGYKVLLDERNERAGVKFTDAELIGIPKRIVVGKGIADGLVEFVNRKSTDKLEIGIDDIESYL